MQLLKDDGFDAIHASNFTHNFSSIENTSGLRVVQITFHCTVNDYGI